MSKLFNNYAVAAMCGLIGTVAWLTSGSGGACLTGRCLMQLTIMATLAAVPAATAQHEGALPEKAIIAAVERFHEALRRGDADEVMAILAPDTTILESGASQTREDYAREHLGEDIAFAKATSNARLTVNVRQEGKAAWMMSTYRTSGSFEGKSIDSIGAELVVLTQMPEGWQIRAIHWSSRKAPVTN